MKAIEFLFSLFEFLMEAMLFSTLFILCTVVLIATSKVLWGGWE